MNNAPAKDVSVWVVYRSSTLSWLQRARRDHRACSVAVKLARRASWGLLRL